ncbi:MAG: P-II family nitrogen regulator, partial [Clostridiaceae bacterium]
MNNTPYTETKLSYEMIVVISNINMGSKISKVGKKAGIHGCTIKLGRGTAKSYWLNFFELSDIRKEIVYMLADNRTAEKAIKDIMEEFHFEKPNHGIMFTIPLTAIEGVHGIEYNKLSENNSKEFNEKGVDEYMHHLITIIVDKGKAEEVMESAERAGAKGGTIMNARGAGIHETSRLFMMDVEPEKEVIMIISDK